MKKRTVKERRLSRGLRCVTSLFILLYFLRSWTVNNKMPLPTCTVETSNNPLFDYRLMHGDDGCVSGVLFPPKNWRHASVPPVSRCRLPGDSLDISVSMTYVLTLNSSSSVALDTYLHSLPQLYSPIFVFHAIRGHFALNGLSKGEVGVRQSFVNIFQDALEKRAKTILIFEDDINFIINYGEAFQNILRDSQCSCFLDSRTGCYPGILLLGATPWGKGSVPCMEEEAAATKGLCVEHMPKNFGAFAVMMNTDVLPALMSMIKQTSMPLDWYWSELAKAGYVVRTAFPFLNIPDVAKKSSVKNRFQTEDLTELEDIARKRMSKHGWDRAIYINPHTGKPFRI